MFLLIVKRRVTEGHRAGNNRSALACSQQAMSGYIFLIENMPPFQWLSHLIPATYYIRILRGIVLRGAGMADLWSEAVILRAMGCGAILLRQGCL